MKKKLEAELISIAHRILKLKNKSDLIQLHQEAQKLYEKLSVLKFVEENFAEAKPTIGYKEIEDKLEGIFESENDAPAKETPKGETSETETEKAEAVEEKASVSEVENNEDALAETEKEPVETVEETASTEAEKSEEQPEEPQIEPVAESESPEENVSETEKSETSAETENESKSDENQPESPSETSENTPEPFAHITQEEVAEETLATAESAIEQLKEEEKQDTPKTENSSFKPSFELAFDPKEDPDTDKFNTPAQTSLEDFLHHNYVDPVFVTPEDLQREKEEKEKEKAAQNYTSYQPTAETPAKSLNDRMAKGIIIGLNDRIAFMNHLFNNSSEDYNRVLSQLMTIDNFREAKNFIETMVKPDYNNWAGKEEYEQRFMEIVEKKFS